MNKTYSELISIPSYIERYRYLKLQGTVSEETYGSRRYINQQLYTSDRWNRFRNKIIIRDNGCDLGVAGFEIVGSIIVHHLNVITFEDILKLSSKVFDEENVICTKLSTHNAIHYGDESKLIIPLTERKAHDTKLW